MATKKYADLFDEGEFDVSIQFRETFVETINMQSKSLYRNCPGNHFNGTEYEIWAEFRSWQDSNLAKTSKDFT